MTATVHGRLALEAHAQQAAELAQMAHASPAMQLAQPAQAVAQPSHALPRGARALDPLWSVRAQQPGQAVRRTLVVESRWTQLAANPRYLR